MPELSLCSTCQTIDFRQLVSIALEDIPAEGSCVSSLGYLNQSNSPNCSLCLLFSSVKTAYPSTRSYQLRAYNHAHLLQARASHSGVDPSPTSGLVLSVLQQHNNKTFHPRIRHHEILNNGLILPHFDVVDDAKSDFQYPFEVKAIGKSVDWTLLQSWITVCKLHHSAKCRPSNDHWKSLPLNVIDCNSQIVVPLPEAAEYFALSYVWGTEHQSRHPHVIDAIPYPLPQMPKTIEDAMTAVIQLGYRYLWVDRYCISWSSERALRNQIAHMDQIFEGAIATIVALYGNDVSAGLPGVSTVQRNRQLSMNINGIRLMSTLPPLLDVLEKSTWSKRGWTYQEGRLSQRLLFFSDTQVYYSCRSMTQSEAIHDEIDVGVASSNCTAAVNLPNLSPALFATGERLRATGNHFVDDRSGYTSRSLTYSSDILDAYRGLLQRSPCHSFWGVSILPEYPSLTTTKMENPNLGLAHGLIWIVNVRKPRNRRPDFPSWSWVSIDGHILSYSWSGALAAGRKYIEATPNYPGKFRSTNVQFWMRDRDQNPRELAEVLNLHHEHFILPEISPVLEIEADLVQIHLTDVVAIRQVSTMVKRMLGFCSDLSGRCRHQAEGTMPCHISLDLPDRHADAASSVDLTICLSAMILVSYIHEKNHDKKGMVMMLLKWQNKSNNAAQRLGLLRLELPLSSRVIEQAPKLRRRISLE